MSAEAPEFLTFEDVVTMHRAQLARWGGLDGIRDAGAIESAIAQAQRAYEYADADLFLLAATYAFHIAEAQGFVDGNKRAAVDAALTFLALNGVRVEDPHAAIADAMIAIAQRALGKEGLADLLRTLP